LYHSTTFRAIDENATSNINKYGIKNSSYADILNAYKFGGIKGVKNTLSSFITSKDLDNINEFNRLVSEEGVTAQTAWYKTMQTSSNAAKELFDNEENLIKSGNSVRLSEEAISNATNTMTFSAKAGEVALKGLAVAGNMLVSLGISAIISLAVKGLDNLVHAADNAKESAESFSNSFKSMNEEFTSNDSKLSDLQKQYDELSKGVNSLGENISLTTDEYDTYKKVISEISDMMPNLLARYDDEGNKIGFVQGKLKDLSAEYDNYKRKKAMDLVNGENDNGDSIKDVFKNYGYQIYHSNPDNQYGDGTTVGIPKAFGSSNYEKIEQLKAQIKYGDGNHAGFSKLTNEEIEEKTALIQKYQSEIDASVSSIQDAMIAIGQSGNEYYKLSDKQQQFFDTYIGNLSQDVIDKNGLYNETVARAFVNNFIKDIKADKNKVLEAYNDLLSFDVNDSSLNPEQIKEQVDKLLQALAKALGNEDWQDLKIRLGFEFVDDNASDYEKFVGRTKNKLSKFGGEGTGKLINFFSANGIDSSKGVNEFLDIYNATEQAKKGIYDADVAMQEWIKHSKEASDTSTSTTLSSAWEQLKASTDDATKGVADDLQDLADKGELTIDTFKATDGAENYFDGLGISAENAVKYINSLSDKNSQVSAMSKNIKSITETLGSKMSDGMATADDFAGFDATIKGLDSWNEFTTLLGDSTSSMEDCQKAANKLATEYVNSNNTLANLNDTNKDYYISNLTDMGITNARTIVEDKLTAIHRKYELNTIQDLGGEFCVAPTIYIQSGAKVQVNKDSATTIVVSIQDTNAIKSDTIQGVRWAEKSKIKFQGKINRLSIRCNGVMKSKLNTVQNTMSLILTVDSNIANSFSTSVANATSYSDISVMLYQRVTKNSQAKDVYYPVGIRMSATGSTNAAPYVDIWGSKSNSDPDTVYTVPSVRLGYLDGLSTTLNGISISCNGYGLYADNVYLNGTIMSNSGSIGGFKIDYNSFTNGTWGTDKSVLVCTGTNSAKAVGGSSAINGWCFTAGSKFGVTTNGDLYASNANISGTITSEKGKIGKYTITGTSLWTGDGSTCTGIGGNQAFWAGSDSSNDAAFRVSYSGKLVATNATISGDITATSGTIGGCSITKGVLKVASGNITSVNADNITSGTLSADRIGANSVTVSKITTENLVGTNGWINLNKGTFNYGSGKLIWDGTTLSMNGTITTSDITATGGTIGGWSLINGQLSSNIEHKTINNEIKYYHSQFDTTGIIFYETDKNYKNGNPNLALGIRDGLTQLAINTWKNNNPLEELTIDNHGIKIITKNSATGIFEQVFSLNMGGTIDCSYLYRNGNLIGETFYGNSTTAKAIKSGAWSNTNSSLTLTPGVYIMTGTILFAASKGGRLGARFATLDNGFDQTTNVIPGTSAAATGYVQCQWIMSVTEGTKYYLQAWQSSGANVNVIASYMKAVRIA